MSGRDFVAGRGAGGRSDVPLFVGAIGAASAAAFAGAGVGVRFSSAFGFDSAGFGVVAFAASCSGFCFDSAGFGVYFFGSGFGSAFA